MPCSYRSLLLFIDILQNWYKAAFTTKLADSELMSHITLNVNICRAICTSKFSLHLPYRHKIWSSVLRAQTLSRVGKCKI